MRAESSAPTRIEMAGGTLDIWPWCRFRPGALTLNAAISLLDDRIEPEGVRLQ